MASDIQIDEIRAEHVATGDPADPHCGQCSSSDYPIWPCDAAIALARIAALEAENRRLVEAGETLWQELVESAFGWDLGLPDRVKADAQVALDGWRAALSAASASSEGRAAAAGEE